MNNIDRIQEYIQDAVISPLERLMNGDSGEPGVNLYEKYYLQGGYPPKDSVYKSLLHAMNQENDATPHTKDTKGILVYPTIDTELDVSYVYKDTNHVIRVSTVNMNQDWQMIEQRLKDIIQEQKQ